MMCLKNLLISIVLLLSPSNEVFGDAFDKVDEDDDPRIVFAEFLIDIYNQKPLEVDPADRRPMPPKPASVGLVLIILDILFDWGLYFTSGSTLSLGRN